jgi:hypothetical protein
MRLILTFFVEDCLTQLPDGSGEVIGEIANVRWMREDVVKWIVDEIHENNADAAPCCEEDVGSNNPAERNSEGETIAKGKSWRKWWHVERRM